VIAALSLFFFTALPGAVLRLRLPADGVDETFLWMERSSRAAARSNETREGALDRAEDARKAPSSSCGCLRAMDGFTFVATSPHHELAGKIAGFATARGRRSGCCSTAAPPT